MPRLLPFAALLLLAYATAVSAADVSPGATTPLTPAEAAAWREDLAFMAAQMKQRHKDLFHTTGEAEFDAAVAALHAAIPRGGRHDAIVGLMRIAALVGDGHTNVSPLKDAAFAFPSLPVKLYDFEDGVHVWAARPGWEHLLGARVERVGGVPIDEARRRVGEISPRDNAMGLRMYFPLFLAMPPVLDALGLSADPASATLDVVVDGESRRVVVPATQVDPSWPPDTDVSLSAPDGWAIATRDGRPPRWLADPLDLQRIDALPDRDALVVRLDMVSDTPEQPLAAFGEKILATVRATNPARVVIDLRLNRGGNHDLRYPFIADLIRAEDDDTALYVLVGRGAFSATQALLDDQDRYTAATFVGEPAASKPNSFGDSYKLQMPNSGLTFRTSLYWHQRDQRAWPWTPVDVAAPPTFADYAAGRDAALETALTMPPLEALGERALAAAREHGAERAVAEAKAWLDDPRHRYANRERTLVRTAWKLAGDGLTAEGVAVAELTVAALPASVDAWTTLALLAKQKGDGERAAEAARRTLALDPENRQVRGIVGG